MEIVLTNPFGDWRGVENAEKFRKRRSLLRSMWEGRQDETPQDSCSSVVEVHSARLRFLFRFPARYCRPCGLQQRQSLWFLLGTTRGAAPLPFWDCDSKKEIG